MQVAKAIDNIAFMLAQEKTRPPLDKYSITFEEQFVDPVEAEAKRQAAEDIAVKTAKGMWAARLGTTVKGMEKTRE